MLRHRFTFSWLLIMSLTCCSVIALGLSTDAPLVAAHTKSPPSPVAKAAAKPANITVPVYLTAKQKVQQVPLEQYVLGVVAAEMPDRFASEALKAQAIAARTYIVHKMMEARQQNSRKPFYIKDSIVDQAYLEPVAMQRKWAAANDAAGLQRLKKAVRATRGVIVVYKKKPIDATYFSTSNGYTENSHDYWGESVPYLQSVASPWDQALSNRYKSTISMSYKEFAKRLGISSDAPRAMARNMQIVARTDGRRIKTLRINNRTMSGRTFREKLGLRSTHFTWRFDERQIVITTFGNGHGVGLSQWGAHGMALQGFQAKQILQHYYRGVEVAMLGDVWSHQK